MFITTRSWSVAPIKQYICVPPIQVFGAHLFYDLIVKQIPPAILLCVCHIMAIVQLPPVVDERVEFKFLNRMEVGMERVSRVFVYTLLFCRIDEARHRFAIYHILLQVKFKRNVDWSDIFFSPSILSQFESIYHEHKHIRSSIDAELLVGFYLSLTPRAVP